MAAAKRCGPSRAAPRPFAVEAKPRRQNAPSMPKNAGRTSAAVRLRPVMAAHTHSAAAPYEMGAVNKVSEAPTPAAPTHRTEATAVMRPRRDHAGAALRRERIREIAAPSALADAYLCAGSRAIALKMSCSTSKGSSLTCVDGGSGGPSRTDESTAVGVGASYGGRPVIAR